MVAPATEILDRDLACDFIDEMLTLVETIRKQKHRDPMRVLEDALLELRPKAQANTSATNSASRSIRT